MCGQRPTARPARRQPSVLDHSNYATTSTGDRRAVVTRGGFGHQPDRSAVVRQRRRRRLPPGRRLAVDQRRRPRCVQRRRPTSMTSCERKGSLPTSAPTSSTSSRRSFRSQPGRRRARRSDRGERDLRVQFRRPDRHLRLQPRRRRLWRRAPVPADSHRSAGSPTGAHTFTVRAIDANGNIGMREPQLHRGGCRRHRLRRSTLLAPQTRSPRGPANKTEKTKAKFKFTSTEPGSTFECKLDKRPVQAVHVAAKVQAPRRGQAQVPRAGDRSGRQRRSRRPPRTSGR